jgi:hypothetical protein
MSEATWGRAAALLLFLAAWACPAPAQWLVPDKGTAQADVQSILFGEYLKILSDGLSGDAIVLSGGACSAQGSPDMTVAVSKAGTRSGDVMNATAAGNATITTADATHPRLDLVVITSAGAIAVRAGTAAAAPKPPTRSAGDVALCAVYVPASDTTISTNQIVDMRMLKKRDPVTLYKTVAAETTNNTAATIQALNKANSGVTIPSGLFLAGKVLRVRLGGNMLLNSGTPTVRIVIAYGGTTMFSDTSAASTADADRVAWWIDFDIVAQAHNDQSLNGALAMGIIAAKTAPTSGIGDAWSTAYNIAAVSGSAAVDSDAGNRLLSVQITFNVANAANELVVEYATVELL